jgi:hypothetical protein
VPVGFLITAGLVALGMGASLWPPARSGLLGLATWFVSAIVNESPFLAFYYMGISTWLAWGEFHGAQAWVAIGLATAPFLGTPVLVRRWLRAVRAIEQALDRDVGPWWLHAGKSIAPSPPWGRGFSLAPGKVAPGASR